MSRKLNSARIREYGKNAALLTGFVALVTAASAAAAANPEGYTVPAPQPRKKVVVTLKALSTYTGFYGSETPPEPIVLEYAFDEDLEIKEYASMAYAESADVIKSGSVLLDWTMLVKVTEDGMTVSATRYNVSRSGYLRATR